MLNRNSDAKHNALPDKGIPILGRTGVMICFNRPHCKYLSKKPARLYLLMTMKKSLTPQQKKRYRYERDHEVFTRYPHDFRKLWPRIKAMNVREDRRKIHQLLTQVDDKDTAELQDSNVKATRRICPIKWYVRSVQDRVNFKLENRRSRIAWNYFKCSYSSEKHRKSFKRFLHTLMLGNTQETKYQAEEVSKWLSMHDSKQHIWINQFFLDEPEMHMQLESWVLKFNQ